jgi:nickel/cobalt exporter
MSAARRAAAAIVLTLAALVAAAPAAAHPLGNFSVNHLTEASVSSGRVELRYILDQAEIPTFQERGIPASTLLARKRAVVLRGLAVSVDGRRARLRPEAGASISFPPGQGGLRLTRVVLPLSAAIRLPARVTIRDATFPGRVGWVAIVSRPGRGTAVRSDATSADPTHGLRRYPAGVLSSPSEERSATLVARRGTGTLTAPRAAGARATTTRRSGDGFAGAFERAASGGGTLVLLLLAAAGWGAVHALSPGHGKAMVAAYLVGTRGTARHAIALGLIVTVTHTAGVFALGLVTLLLSQYVLPEQLYPWLNLVSGLLVVAIGAGVLRARIRWGRARGRDAGADDHQHRHGHQHGHDGHGHGHDHHGHDHNHAPPRLTWRGLTAAGAAAGLIPCPSALVVLLAAVAQHEVALGLGLIVAFSAGLAGTLTALGLAVVSAGRVAVRLDASGRAVAVLPAISALAICGVGCLLTLRALGQFASWARPVRPEPVERPDGCTSFAAHRGRLASSIRWSAMFQALRSSPASERSA